MIVEVDAPRMRVTVSLVLRRLLCYLCVNTPVRVVAPDALHR